MCNRFTWILLLIFHLSFLKANEGTGWINPITDICWNCLFPIHISGVNVTPEHKDPVKYSTPLCFCSGMPPKAGLPMAFWEPVAFVDVTHVPYKALFLGGITLGDTGVRKRGGLAHVGDSNRSSFYNVHYYSFPILSWLGLLTDFPCLEKTDNEFTYFSEIDQFWDDEEWAALLFPEAFAFANEVAQVACIADCAKASFHFPIDTLFWCAGCMGSLYPCVGHVTHHVGAIQASYLLVHRLLAKLHAQGILLGFEEDNFCEKSRFLRLKKSLYKTQLVYPVAHTKAPCPPLGKSDVVWGAGKTFPVTGEDFIYLIWAKKQCCLDAVKPAMKAIGGS